MKGILGLITLLSLSFCAGKTKLDTIEGNLNYIVASIESKDYSKLKTYITKRSKYDFSDQVFVSLNEISNMLKRKETSETTWKLNSYFFTNDKSRISTYKTCFSIMENGKGEKI